MANIATALQKKGSTRSTLTASQRQEIEKLAYQFFVDRGYKNGYDQTDWLRAETIVRNKKA